MLFDRPLWSDPLWWFGLVGGAVGGLWRVLAHDLTGTDAVFQFLAVVGGFTFWIAGIVGCGIRGLYRRVRDRSAA